MTHLQVIERVVLRTAHSILYAFTQLSLSNLSVDSGDPVVKSTKSFTHLNLQKQLVTTNHNISPTG